MGMEQGLFKFELASKKIKYSSEDKVIIWFIANFFQNCYNSRMLLFFVIVGRILSK
jgi:hypothetical protein